MSVRVVDASALGALVFGEPKADRISKTLSDELMAAPPFIWFELASICLKKIKGHPSQKIVILEAFDLDWGQACNIAIWRLLSIIVLRNLPNQSPL